jgi:TM2 domain-containing membrane protein YozV
VQQQPVPPPPQYGAQPGYPPAPMVNDPRKSKVAAGLLGILLGAFGVHNFYLGYTGKAIAQLLITVLSCGILAIVSSIWGIVEGIMILTGSINTDAAGVPLKD